MPSVYEQLIDATAAAVQALNLRHLGVTVPVEKRKLPGVDEELSAVPVDIVASDPAPAKDEPWSTGGALGAESLREYLVDVVRVTVSNFEPRKGLADSLLWRQGVQRRLGGAKPLAVTELYEARVELEPPFEPEAYSKLYDYSRVRVRYSCVEPSFAS